MLRFALYRLPLYGYYLGRAIAPRCLSYRKVCYAIGFVDDAVDGALAESIAYRGLVEMQPIR